MIDGHPHIAVDEYENAHIAARVGWQKTSQVTYAGGDILYCKFDSSGRMLFARQFGTSETDTPGSIAAGEDGGAYVLVNSAGSIDGFPNAGGSDILVVRFDGEGKKL